MSGIPRMASGRAIDACLWRSRLRLHGAALRSGHKEDIAVQEEERELNERLGACPKVGGRGKQRDRDT